MALWAGLATAAAPEPTVLVTDFQAPPVVEWEWARRGLPELAVAALGECGVTTVDRDLLSVLSSEQKLAVGQEPDRGGLQLGQMLGATYLLTGVAETTGVSRLRLSGSLTRVETAEQVAAFSTEGEYKKELQALVARWVEGLAKGLSPNTSRIEEKPSTQINPIKPEALMLFQQGVDACAARKPALAVGFFLNAHIMDPRLRAAKEWEAHAYELGGLTRHAASVRQHAALSDPSEPGIVSKQVPTQDVQRVVTVLTPVWLAGTNLTAVGIAALSVTAMKQVVEEAALTCKGIRLYRPDLLAASVAETDRQLSLQFNPYGVSRYARWLMSDITLYSTVSPSAGGKIQVEIGLLDAPTAQRLNTLSRQVERDQVAASLCDAVRECLSTPKTQPGDTSPSNVRHPCIPLSESDIDQLPAAKFFTRALDMRMRGVETISVGQVLTDHYTSTKMPDLAAVELDFALRKIEEHNPEMDHQLFLTYWWCKGYGYWSMLGAGDAGLREGIPLTAESLYEATSEAFRKRIDAIRERLLSDFPSSLCTYAVYHQEAMIAYQAERWERCASYASAALQALEGSAQAGSTGRVDMFAFLKTEESTRALLEINCLYLRCAACRHLGSYEQATKTLDLIDERLRKNNEIHPLCVITPVVSYNDDNDRVRVSFGQYRTTGYLGESIEREREEQVIDRKNHLSLQALATRDAVLASRVEALQKREAKTPTEHLAFLRDVADVWAELPPVTYARCPLAEHTIKRIPGISLQPIEERQTIAHNLAQNYLKATGMNPERLSDHRDLEACASRMKFIIECYSSLGIGIESMAWLDRWLDESAAPTFGRDLLDAVMVDLSNSIRLPFVHLPDSFVPNSRKKQETRWMNRVLSANVAVTFREGLVQRLIDRQNKELDDIERVYQDFGWEQDPASRPQSLDENPDAQYVLHFFERHKKLPDALKLRGRFWRTLSDRASLYGAYRIWFQAGCLAQKSEGDDASTPNTYDHYVVRLALDNPGEDLILTALRMREEMGLSAKPIPSLAWYAAGSLCVTEGAFDKALQAFHVFRQTYDEAEWPSSGMLLENEESDYSIRWSLEYFEGLALAATGQEAAAATLFRRLSLRFGAQVTRFWQVRDDVHPESHGYNRQIGLLAAEELQKLHAKASGNKVSTQMEQ